MAEMDAYNLKRLKEEQEKALRQTDSELEQWKKFQSDYASLRDCLRTLPNKTTHNVMAPFGSLAFMPGQLVHTNEILVLLGDNYFVERSATQAMDIANRRLKETNKNIEALKKQREMLTPRAEFTSEMIQMASGEGEQKEIIEEYDEEQERLWRERHREYLRQQGQKQTKGSTGKKRETEIRLPKTDTDYWDILDQLEQQENERQELDSLEEEEVQRPAQRQSEVMTNDGDQSSEDDTSSLDQSENPDEEEEDSSDDEEEEIIDCVRKITFSHSKQQDEPSSRESESGGSTDSINSPADLYRLVEMPPRSILKTPAERTAPCSKGVRHASQEQGKRVSFVQGQGDGKVSPRKKIRAGHKSASDEEMQSGSLSGHSRVQAFSDRVIERALPSEGVQQSRNSSTTSPVGPTPEKNTGSDRPMSKFRAAREKKDVSADSQGKMDSDVPSADSQGSDASNSARPMSKFRASRLKQGGGC